MLPKLKQIFLGRRFVSESDSDASDSFSTEEEVEVLEPEYGEEGEAGEQSDMRELFCIIKIDDFIHD